MRKIFLVLEILYLLSFQNIDAQDVYKIDSNPISFYTEKYQRNVLLTAFGTSPEWSLELFKNNILLLQLPNQKVVKAEIYAFLIDSVNQSTSYFGMVENGYIQLTVNKKTVENFLTGKEYNYQAELHFHNTATSYYLYQTGFATWIPNIKLENTWLLTNINEEDYLNKYQYQIFQRIKFNFQTNSITGFSGCNEFKGNFTIDNQFIEIENIELIKNEKCKFNEIENNFLAILRNKSYQYTIENNVLTLISGSNKLVFKVSY